MSDAPKTITPRVIVQMLLFVVVQPFLPLIISWHWGWLEAWIFTNMVTPFFLDTLWGLLPAIILTIILLIRTQLEDGTLQNTLEGYRDYTRRVRYRLLPGIW